MNIDFGRPFQFVFEDKDWMKKVLLGGLFFLIPFVGIFVVMGYQRRIILQTAEGGSDTPLPEWDRFGDDLVEGLKMFVVMLGYVFPGLVLYIGGGLAGAIGAEMAGDAGAMLGLISCLGLPLLMIGGLLSPVGILRYVDTGSIGAAFSVGGVIAFVKENFVNILLGLVIGMIGQFLAQFGMIACFVGVLFTGAWAMMLQGHAWGQVLRISRQKQGVPGGAPAASY